MKDSPIQQGQRYTCNRELQVLLLSHAASVVGRQCVLPAGTQFEIVRNADDQTTWVVAKPLNVPQLQRSIVPLYERLKKWKKQTYELYIRRADLKQSCVVINGENPEGVHEVAEDVIAALKVWIQSWIHPQVTICIPSCNHLQDLLLPCLMSLAKTCKGRALDVIIGDSGSDPSVIDFYQQVGLPFISIDGEFNFSRSCNRMAEKAQGKYLLFLNNDTEAKTMDWADILLKNLPQGAMGAVLLSSRTQKIQHVGVDAKRIAGREDFPEGYRPDPDSYNAEDYAFLLYHPGTDLKFEDRDAIDFSDVLAVTGAFLCTPRQVFQQLGGFDEAYDSDLQDVDYCLKVRQADLPITCSKNIIFNHRHCGSRQQYGFPAADWKLLGSRWNAALSAWVDGDMK